MPTRGDEKPQDGGIVNGLSRLDISQKIYQKTRLYRRIAIGVSLGYANIFGVNERIFLRAAKRVTRAYVGRDFCFSQNCFCVSENKLCISPKPVSKSPKTLIPLGDLGTYVMKVNNPGRKPHLGDIGDERYVPEADIDFQLERREGW